MKEEAVYDLLQIRFIRPIRVNLQPHLVMDLIEEVFFGGRMDHF